jgi:hypothetical protein
MKEKYKTNDSKQIPSFETAPSCSIEQFWLSQCLHFYNINPTFLFQEKDYKMWDEFIKKTQHLTLEYGFTHLFGSTKWEPSVIKKVESKIRELQSSLQGK